MGAEKAGGGELPRREDFAREARELLRLCWTGPADAASLVKLTVMERAAGLPLTFVTPAEWLRFKWGEVLTPMAREAWRDWPDSLAWRRKDVLFGAWLAWHANFVMLASSGGEKAAVRRLSGRRVGRVLLEELYAKPGAPGRRLYVSLAFLANPLLPGDTPACLACMLHDARDGVWGAAAAWNVPGSELEGAEEALVRWAEGRATVAGTFVVAAGQGVPVPGFPLNVLQQPWLLDIPCADVSRSLAGGKVVPFPLERRRGEGR